VTAVVTNLSQGETAQVIGEGISLQGLTDGAPAVGITVGGLDPNGPSVVNVWRRADSRRQAVKGARRRTITGADYFVDYEVPLGRDVWYELEFLEGALEPLVQSAGIRIDTDRGYISDPTVPASAVEIFSQGLPDGYATLAHGAVDVFTLGSESALHKLQESTLPVAITSGRGALAGVGLPLLVDNSTQSALLRQLVESAVILMLRPLPEWSDLLPGVCYVLAQSCTVQQLDRHTGGTLEQWQLGGDLVAAPAAGVVVPVISYGDVEPAWATYGHLQDAMQTMTYLDAQRDPFGATTPAMAMTEG